jgi:hypothetical protein
MMEYWNIGFWHGHIFKPDSSCHSSVPVPEGEDMEISVDRQHIELAGAQSDNLEEILMKVMSEHVQPGKIITAVTLNGTGYSEKNPHDAAGVPLQDIKTLEIATMSAEEMARHFFTNGCKYLDLLIKGAEKISELFRVTDETEANEHYAEYLENLRLFLQMIAQCTQVLHLDLSAIPFQKATVKDEVQKLSGVMDQMLKVQESEDWVMLADLLEYELIPLLRGWESITGILLNEKGGGCTAPQS